MALNVTGGKRKEGRENIGYKRHYLCAMAINVTGESLL
jgi:hypothetical protein